MIDHPRLRTSLYDLHVELRARLGPFAGYDMPVWYGDGAVSEHLHTRSSASLFDVSHMGIVELKGGSPAEAFERLVPSSVVRLGEGRLRYTFLTNEAGGIIDDLIVTRHRNHLSLVLNASRRQTDCAHLRAHLEPQVKVVERSDLALVALQGPKAVDVLGSLDPAAAELAFMECREISVAGIPVQVSRSGYTGEDGFELALPVDHAEKAVRHLLANPTVRAAGLAARDSLRLEAGLCLYGQDLDETTTPIEAGLSWAVQKRRLSEGGFLGADVIRAQAAGGAKRVRVGLAPVGPRLVRGGPLTSVDGQPAGNVTSGGFGPTVGGPIAMGYVDVALAAVGTTLNVDARGRSEPCRVVDLPFVPHRYHRA